VIIVNDGSLFEGDEVLDDLAELPGVQVLHQVNGGLGAARNAGIRQSWGRYVFTLDSDNFAEPTFVARAVAMLEAEPSLAYVTSWLHFVDERGDDFFSVPGLGYHPLGNFSGLLDRMNSAGDAAAVWPRRLFDLGFTYTEEVAAVEDWTLYRQMQGAGHQGAVIPERLIRYRVRPDSMYRLVDDDVMLGRLSDEIGTRMEIMDHTWTRSNA
jgi:glycosyltransferase involved in cell wall biosynthesis